MDNEEDPDHVFDFHTRMVDNLDEMISETSDISLFCFYSRFFEDNFQTCLEFPAQNRFIGAFPLICGHDSNKKKREKAPKEEESEKPGHEGYRKTRAAGGRGNGDTGGKGMGKGIGGKGDQMNEIYCLNFKLWTTSSNMHVSVRGSRDQM